MTKDLIIPAKELKESDKRSEVVHSALQDFNLPVLSMDKLETEKNQFFKILRDCIVDVNVIQQIANSKVLIAEIPPEFRKLYLEGKVKLDDSAKVLGNHTPNLRDGDGNLIGQATIKEGFNPAEITNALANLALYDSIQQISQQVEILDEKVSDIQQGQKEDRYAKITSTYETYELMLDDMQKVSFTPTAIGKLKEGLHQIHFGLSRDIEDFRIKAPKNKWQNRWNSFWHFKRGYYTDEMKGKLKQLNEELYLYYGFVLLSDMLMNDMGQTPQHIKSNHNDIDNLCHGISADDILMNKLSFVKEAEYTEVEFIKKAEEDFVKLLGQNVGSVQLELSPMDIKLLNQ